MIAQVTMPPELPGDTPTWRYIEYWKFVSFLQRGKLWFACPFTFKDKWDGLYGKSGLAEMVRRSYSERSRESGTSS